MGTQTKLFSIPNNKGYVRRSLQKEVRGSWSLVLKLSRLVDNGAYVLQ
jgi:hypothetical protein